MHRAFLLAPVVLLLAGGLVPALGRRFGSVGVGVGLLLAFLALFIPMFLATQTSATLESSPGELRVRWGKNLTVLALNEVTSAHRAHRRIALKMKSGRLIWLLPQRFVSGGEQSGWLADSDALNALVTTLQGLGLQVTEGEPGSGS